MRGLLVGAAPSADAGLVPALAAECELVIAVDGGGAACVESEVVPDLLVGDMDSISAGALTLLEEAGVEIVRMRMDKDESDLDAALREAAARGCDRVVLTGVSGGRGDHQLAVYGALVRADELWPAIVERDSSAWLLARDGRRALSLEPAGAIVSVLPLSRRGRARSIGLQWSLGGLVLEPMSSRGLSNVVTHAPAAIEWESGELLVVSERCGECGPAREI